MLTLFDNPTAPTAKPTQLVLPTLYKKTSTGAIQLWSIWCEGSTIVTEYGQVNGKKQQTFDTITEGKNVGRSNETTAEQQAQLEAKAQWEKKAKKGYVETINDAEDGKTHAVIEGGIFPMLAQSYSKHAAKINFPAHVQPKLDGHRCIAVVEQDGSVTLWSRTRKPITGVPHIIRALEAMGLRQGTILDGELYNHDYRNRFEELTSFIRQVTPKDGHEVVQYHVYDVAHDSDAPFSERARMLRWISGQYTTKVVAVYTTLVDSVDELMIAFDDFVSDGYEGAIVRNADGKYVNKRSYDLQKVKEFADAEYRIVGVNEGRGKMAGKAIFVCETPEGKTFAVKMKGALDDLSQYVDDPDLAIGRLLTVQYQDLTADGIPRFPVGLRFREDV